MGTERRRILILGGYGQLGRAVADLLANETEAELVICGRDLDKAEPVVRQLTSRFPGRVFSARRVDVAYAEETAAALAGVDLLVICTTDCGSGGDVLRAALRAGVDCVDLRYPQSLASEALSLRREVEQAGRCFFTQAGHLPGLASVLLRLAVEGNGGVRSAELATMIRLPAMTSAGAADEIVGIIRDLRREVLEAGQWRRAGLRAIKKIDFGERFGTALCVPVHLAELDDLPARLGVRHAAMHVAGANRFVDMVVVPLIMLLRGMRGQVATRLLARLLMFGVNSCPKPPFGAVFQVATENGSPGGQDMSVKIKLHSGASYHFAAAAAVAGLLQYLDGSIAKPGLWFMGHEADPQRMLVDMGRMGVVVETEEDSE